LQDLESKLRHAKREVLNLKFQMEKKRLAAPDESEWRQNSSESDIREPLEAFSFQHIREEIITRSPGLFNVPPAWRETIPDVVSDGRLESCYDQQDFRPVLPPRPFIIHLLHLFTTEVFAIGPTVFVKEFGEKVSQMYVSEHRRDDGGISI
jgi:hypothetical protein